MLRVRPELPLWRWRRARARCRALLPAELAWAAPLLEDPPRPVLCGEPRAQALARWLENLPATAQIPVTYTSHNAGPEPIVA